MAKVSFYKSLSGTLLIAGTSVGAGMLGIPLVTGTSGFGAAFIVTLVVWFFMYCTGILFLEATLWMREGAHVLSISQRFLGSQGRFFAGSVFLFLYYCLLIAYFAAGAPLFANVIKTLFSIQLQGALQYVIFGLVFGSIVSVGLSFINRINYILMTGLVLSYVLLVSIGGREVDFTRLTGFNFTSALFATPILFSAFGYHNVIPSLTFYFDKNEKVMRRAIFFGTLFAFIIYMIWQWLIIGAIDPSLITDSLQKGVPITNALEVITKNVWLKTTANSFALFAIITSMLGVSFSMVDFLADGLKMKRKGFDRFLLCLLTFLPPLLLVSFNPDVFVLAISFAGGFGEAFLNGLLPIALVWVGKYQKFLQPVHRIMTKKPILITLFLFAILVMVIEVLFVFKKF